MAARPEPPRKAPRAAGQAASQGVWILSGAVCAGHLAVVPAARLAIRVGSPDGPGDARLPPLTPVAPASALGRILTPIRSAGGFFFGKMPLVGSLLKGSATPSTPGSIEEEYREEDHASQVQPTDSVMGRVGTSHVERIGSITQPRSGHGSPANGAVDGDHTSEPDATPYSSLRQLLREGPARRNAIMHTPRPEEPATARVTSGPGQASVATSRHRGTTRSNLARRTPVHSTPLLKYSSNNTMKDTPQVGKAVLMRGNERAQGDVSVANGRMPSSLGWTPMRSSAVAAMPHQSRGMASTAKRIRLDGSPSGGTPLAPSPAPEINHAENATGDSTPADGTDTTQKLTTETARRILMTLNTMADKPAGPTPVGPPASLAKLPPAQSARRPPPSEKLEFAGKGIASTEVAGEPDASFKAATKPSLGPDVYGSGKAGSQAFKLDLSFPAVSNGTAPVDQSSVLPKSHSGGAVQAPGAAGKAPASVSLSQLDETPSDPKPAPPPLGLGVQSSVADAATKSGRLGASRDGPVFSFSTNENNSSLIKSITSGRSPAGVEPTFSFDMNAPTATTPPGAVFMPTKAALPITLEGLPSSSLAEAAATPLPPEDESDGNTVDNGQPSAHAAGGWDDAFLKNSSAASQAASAAISQDIETQEGGLSEPAPSQPAVAVSTAPSSTPLSAAAGWGGAFLKANASFNQAASNAIAEEIVQSKCGAPIPLPVSPGGWGNDFLTANASANASTAARNDMTSKRADVSVPAPASGGWGDAFLEKNEPAKLAASSAVAAEINEQKGKASALPVAGGGWGDAFLKANASASATAAAAVQKEIEKEKGGSSAPAAASSGSFATAPSATNILFRAPASQPASQPGLSFGAVPGGSSSGAPAPLFSFGASRASAAAGGTFTFGMGSFSAAASQPAFVSTTTAPASTGMQNTMSITETPSPASAATATPAFGTTPASTPSFSVPSLGSSAMFGSVRQRI
eukprot:jgi/Tetstr1/456151/TSEL_042919.t1